MIRNIKSIKEWSVLLGEPESVIRGVVIQTSAGLFGDKLIYNKIEYGECEAGSDNLTIRDMDVFKEAIKVEGKQYR